MAPIHNTPDTYRQNIKKNFGRLIQEGTARGDHPRRHSRVADQTRGRHQASKENSTIHSRLHSRATRSDSKFQFCGAATSEIKWGYPLLLYSKILNLSYGTSQNTGPHDSYLIKIQTGPKIQKNSKK